MSMPLRVLIVEDIEDDALLMLRVLREGGYAPSSLRVETAITLAVALETHPWDIVLCDYTLPQYSGADALALVRSRKPDLPVIFVTGTIGEEAAVRLIKVGASDYVLKDRLARLPIAVEQALREAAERRTHEETQRALHDTAMQLAGILEVAMDAIFEIDAAGTIRLVNEAAHRLFGWPPGTLLNQPLSAIVPPEHREQHATGLQRFLETGEGAVIGQTTEVTGLRRDGTRVCCELSVSSLTHKNGDQRFVGILRDLTERKQNQQKLEEQLHIKTFAADVAAALTGSTDSLQACAEAMVRHLGAAFARIWTLDPAENVLILRASAGMYTNIEGRHYRIPVGQYKIGLIAQERQPHLTNCVIGDPRVHDQEWAKREGMVAFAGYPLLVEGHVLGVMAMFARQPLSEEVLQAMQTIAHGIAQFMERKRAEAALRQSEEWFRFLTENAPDLITVLDPDGTIRYESPSVYRLSGYAPADLLGKPVSDFIHPDDLSKASAILAEALQTPGTCHSTEARFRRADGQWLTLEAIGHAVHDSSNGTPPLAAAHVCCNAISHAVCDSSNGMVVVVNSRDIAERKKMEAHASRMEHMALLGQLMGGIAHEIKNPLFILTGSMQLLNDRLANKEYDNLRGNLDRMDEAAKRISQTVQRFLSIVRPAPPAQEPCAVQAILQQTLDFLRHEFLTNQVSVEADLTPNLPSIESDLRLLQEVFLNLIVNAVQAMREAHGKGKLTVSAAAAEGGWIEVRIQDDGPGIPPEYRAKLFEPFFTTKPIGVGTGLGLWTVRSNLATVGGTVTLETEVGQGTTFIVRLPVKKN